MDLKDIQELIKFVAKSGATEVDLEIDNIKISIKSPPKKRRGKEEESTDFIQKVPAQFSVPEPAIIPAVAPAVTPAVAPDKTTSNTENQESSNQDVSKYITIKASMIVTFYRSSNPESDPFVNVGDSINIGDPICIIEAMKLFNEIESEVSGKIIKVLADDTTPVEFDQPLFLIDPS